MERTKVLLVDDEIEFASSLAERLELRGFEATAVTSGEEALGSLHSEPPDVVLLDLKMPDMNGLDILPKIKALDATIEVIILTGHGSRTAKDSGMLAGAFDYIMKPVDISELVTKIKQAKERRGAAVT